MDSPNRSNRKASASEDQELVGQVISTSDIQIVVQETVKSLQGENHIFKEFLQLYPPEFDGSLGQEETAEEFILDLENIYQVFKISDEMKVRLATFRLRRQAREWWREVRDKFSEQGLFQKWEQFVEEFYRKYRPQWMCEQWEDSFINLKQEDMSVPEYVHHFEKLSKYCQRLIKTEEYKISKFIKGLRVKLQTALAVVPRISYNHVVERAIKIEICQKEKENDISKSFNDGTSNEIHESVQEPLSSIDCINEVKIAMRMHGKKSTGVKIKRSPSMYVKPQ